MSKLGLNVPPGFTITTDVCAGVCTGGGALPPGVWEDVLAALSVVERATGKRYGAGDGDPLLVSVRSGAALSMPGMMDTILGCGLTRAALPRLAAARGARLAADARRRFLDMYANVVLGVPHSAFEAEMNALKEKVGAKIDADLSADDLTSLCATYEKIVANAGVTIPDDPHTQLRDAVTAVFRSWMTPRAVKYRELNRITGLAGTACNVQAMVYGNASPQSATGVFFSRNPGTGEPGLYGEFLVQAAGEDVVAGIRTPQPVSDLAALWPAIHAELSDNVARLERHYKDLQDIEMTVEGGRLFMLQCRVGKRTGRAALRIALDMHSEGLVSTEEALLMVQPDHLVQLLHPTLADDAVPRREGRVAGSGLAASPGAAVGTAVFTPEAAEAAAKDGKKVILIRQETSADDVGGMYAAAGILTARGGQTSHAAVVARGWGKPCVCGVAGLAVDEAGRVASLGAFTFREGDALTINGMTGEVIAGAEKVVPPTVEGGLAEFLSWADAARRLGVRANADTPDDVGLAMKNGAEGIGLVRTEHMWFLSADRLKAMRQMIGAVELASPDDGEAAAARAAALATVKSYQKKDFVGILRAAAGAPVTVRLLDPPLHEFLPHGAELDALVKSLAAAFAVSRDAVAKRIASLHEANPMMGLRGARLGIVHPEIFAVQAAAVAEAALEVAADGIPVSPHIMVPLVATGDEMARVKSCVDDAVARVLQVAEAGAGGGGGGGAGAPSITVKVGTMVELPRAALAAADLVKAGATFFSIGSNDLTQATFGFSRDDAEAHFLPVYVKAGLLPADPFVTLDTAGVGELITMAVARGRSVDPGLEVGLCGEHGGDASSIAFCERAGLTYVSCSPLRVPVARLAAAQAAIKARKEGMGQAHNQD